MNIVAIIPARAGSKRIVSKNIKDFLGESILSRTISRARESSIFDAIYVSTDSVLIAEIASSAGAEIILRGEDLSDDFTDTPSVIAHAITEGGIEEFGKESIVCCIYPATPLLEYERIKEGLTLLERNNCSYVFPVQKSKHPVERFFRLNSRSGLESMKIYERGRTQDYPEAFHDAGQFYLGTLETWQSKAPLLSDSSFGILLSKYEVVDIDDEEDWKFSEEIFKIRESKK